MVRNNYSLNISLNNVPKISTPQDSRLNLYSLRQIPGLITVSKINLEQRSCSATGLYPSAPPSFKLQRRWVIEMIQLFQLPNRETPPPPQSTKRNIPQLRWSGKPFNALDNNHHHQRYRRHLPTFKIGLVYLFWTHDVPIFDLVSPYSKNVVFDWICSHSWKIYKRNSKNRHFFSTLGQTWPIGH